MLGENELKKLFPDFKELIQPSGIDLRIDEVFVQVGPGSLIDNEKNLPEIEILEPPIYILKPKTAYLATVDRKIKIPKGCSMLISTSIYPFKIICICTHCCGRPWILWDSPIHVIQLW